MRTQGSTHRSTANDERCESYADLLRSLERRIKDPDGDNDSITPLLDGLRTKLRGQLLHQSGGLLEEAVFQAPWLTNFAESLRHEHVELLQLLDTLRERVTRSGDDVESGAQAQQAYQEFVELFEKYNEGCRNLLYESQLCQGHLHNE